MDKKQIQKKFNTFKDQAKKKVLATAVFILAGFMVVSTIKFTNAATDTTDFEVSITAGSLTIDNTPGTLTFPSGNPGQDNVDSGTNFDDLVVNDQTGGGGWNVQVQLTASWVASTDATKQIAENSTTVFPQGTTITQLAGDPASDVTKGSDDAAVDSAVDYVGSVNSGDEDAAGAYQIDDGRFQLDVPQNASTTTYIATIQIDLT